MNEPLEELFPLLLLLLLPLWPLLLPVPAVAGCLLPDVSDFFSALPDVVSEEAPAGFFSADSDPPSVFVLLAATLAFWSARLSVR